MGQPCLREGGALNLVKHAQDSGPAASAAPAFEHLLTPISQRIYLWLSSANQRRQWGGECPSGAAAVAAERQCLADEGFFYAIRVQQAAHRR